MPMKVVFFGTSSFAANVLSFLIENQISIQAIVTRVDKPKGRNLELSYPPVKQTAVQVCPHIPIYQPIKASTPEFAEILKSLDPDLFVVVAYGEIIKQNLLDIPKKASINIHASLLPKYRGAAPMQRCLMEGCKETGISIIEMSLQMDAGDILAMESIPVPPDMTFGELEPKMCELGCQLALKVIKQIESGSAQKTAQKREEATLAPKITAAEEVIDWTKPASKVHNLIRALSPVPGAWCKILLGNQEKRLKIKRSSLISGIQATPGAIVELSKSTCHVACGEDAVSLLEVQLEGKKSMPIAEFLKGIQQSLKFI